MCFSSTASFIAAGVTFAVGVATLTRVDSLRAAPLAAMPMIFAAQQAIEGALWLDLSASAAGGGPPGLSFAFLFFAYVFWPVYVPLAILSLETAKRFRRLLLICAATGLGVGAHLFWWMLTHPYGASIQSHHIVYETGYHASAPIAVAYLAATGLPLVLSSHRWVLWLGALILTGSVVAFIFYWEAFVSVWCFFAAATSAGILAHFQRVRSSRLRFVRRFSLG
ncbi:MAG TPA: DUF6629 family protein [Alphaproteobacteria bacterium]|jgi:hypothetical protein|nr:DUF6629 family protein [Alphaproteobacteria bacterium]